MKSLEIGVNKVTNIILKSEIICVTISTKIRRCTIKRIDDDLHWNEKNRDLPGFFLQTVMCGVSLENSAAAFGSHTMREFIFPAGS